VTESARRITAADLAAIDAREEERRRIYGLLIAGGWSHQAIRGAERRIRREAAHRTSSPQETT
jgi:hypothetical protein